MNQIKNRLERNPWLKLSIICSILIYFPLLNYAQVDSVSKKQNIRTDNLILTVFSNFQFYYADATKVGFGLERIFLGYQKQQGKTSVSLTVKLPKNFEFFGRWDCLFTNNDELKNDEENAWLLGFEYVPTKKVRLIPNLVLKLYDNQYITSQSS